MRPVILLAALALGVAACQTPAEPAAPLQGAWEPQRYLLQDGSEQAVAGLLFFAERDWTVLFFVIDDDGAPQQGSGEGGTYALRGDSLIFTHHYHLSAGAAAGSLPERPLRMDIHTDAAREACTIDLSAEGLTIFFPSGNAMTFRRR